MQPIQVLKTFILTCCQKNIRAGSEQWQANVESEEEQRAVEKLKGQFNVQTRDDKISESLSEHDIYLSGQW